MNKLSNITIDRLVKDVKYLLKNPLDNEKIYYKHDEENILLGYALIIGPPDTPYENGNYLFKFNFPEDYPFSPPKVEYYTNDGKTRFNPNLYVNKYVCLSILNTWRGEGWTSCQTIYSVLMTLQSILNSKPLINEPGYHENHKNVEIYNNIIFYKNLEFTILEFIKYIIIDFINDKNNIIKNNNSLKDEIIKEDIICDNIDSLKYIEFLNIYKIFYSKILNNFIDNNQKIISYVDNNIFNFSNIYCSTYNLNIKLDKKINIINKIKNYYNLIQKYNIIHEITKDNN